MWTRAVRDWVRDGWSERPLRLDAVFYLVCTCYAVALALTDKHYGFQVWAAFAIAGYGLALTHTCWLRLTPNARPGWWRYRWVGVGVVAALAMLAPLATLVMRRLAGGDWADAPGAWSAQPEVWVIERSASLLLETGSPYVDVTALGRPAEVNDYTPYGPVMSLLGLPRALLGGTAVGDALTDARLLFALVAVLGAWASLRLLGGPAVPVRATQLAVVFPLTALTWATAGPDLAIAGMLVLAVALAATDRPGLSATILALVSSAKLIVLPAVVVLGFLVAVRQGKRAVTRFVVLFMAGCTALNLPVLLVDPRAFMEHVFRFPAGLGTVSSPAASPLPGHLLASTGPAGKVLAFVLLGMGALAILVWLVRRPPGTGSEALFRMAVGLGTFTLLTPATRFGYLVYSSVLLGAMLIFSGRAATPLGAAEPGSSTTQDPTSVTSS